MYVYEIGVLFNKIHIQRYHRTEPYCEIVTSLIIYIVEMDYFHYSIHALL